MNASSLVKEVGALFSAIFGIYGIGAETRKGDGALNRAGWVALVGLILSMLVTVTGQFFEDHEHTLDARAEADRYERLLSSAYYAPLSTQGARVDLKFSISMEDLQSVEPTYAKRLDSYYENPTREGCTRDQPYDEPGLRRAYRDTCTDYVYQDDTLSKPELRFDQSSTLMPRDDEPFARELIRHLGVYFDVPLPKDQTAFFYDDPPLFKADRTCEPKRKSNLSVSTKNKANEDPSEEAKACPKDAKFVFEGDVLHVTVLKREWDPAAMENANLTSVIDLLGHEIVLSPNDMKGCPPGAAIQCENLHRVLKTSKMLDRFALTFPHRRDIIFEGPTLSGDEKKGFILVIDSKGKAPLYKHMMSAKVEDLPVTDRRDPDHR